MKHDYDYYDSYYAYYNHHYYYCQNMNIQSEYIDDNFYYPAPLVHINIQLKKLMNGLNIQF